MVHNVVKSLCDGKRAAAPAVPSSGNPGADPSLSRKGVLPVYHAHFEAVREDRPGPVWAERHRRFWPAYERWFRRNGGDASAKGTRHAQYRLRESMPELLPVYERLVELAGADPVAEHFLTLYNPPPFLSGCSQTVWKGEDRQALIRNYDLSPDLSESLFVRTRWLDRSVMGASECLWGVNDGMNDAGLAVSLTYGGSRATGNGFGIPLILRYVLEMGRDVDDAVEAFRCVPSHMAYNVTLLDRRGDYRTIQLHPDERPLVTREPSATNHQVAIADPRHAAWSRSIERLRFLEESARAPSRSLEGAIDRFLDAPLHQRRYREQFGTLYTVAYEPSQGTATLAWPDEAPWVLSLDGFRAGSRTIRYQEHTEDARTRVVADPDRSHAAPGEVGQAGSVPGGVAPEFAPGFPPEFAPSFTPDPAPYFAPDPVWGALPDQEQLLEDQILLARRYGLVSADACDRARREMERTGHIPWELIGTLWAA